MLRTRSTVALIVALAVSVAAVPFMAAEAPPKEAPAPKVVVSVAPVHSLVAQVMAGADTPRLLLQSAASAHRASLKPSDAKALSQADLVIWVGPLLEAPLAKSIRSLATDAKVLELARAPGVSLLPLREGGAWDAHEGEQEHKASEIASVARALGSDAHIWLDPDNAKTIVDAVAGALAEIDPRRAELYAENASRAHAEIAALDREIEERLAPVRNVPFVVFHDAYQYFESHYGLTAVGSMSLGADRGTGAKRLIELRKKIRDANAVCVFSEPQFEPRLVRTLTEDTGTRTGVLDPLGAALEPGPGQYPRLMRDLAEALRACLKPEE